MNLFMACTQSLKVWNAELKPRHGPVISVAADNDSTNASTMGLLLEDTMPECSLKQLLLKLKLFLPCSDIWLTAFGTDDQHNGKNVREIFIRKKGVRVDNIRLAREEFLSVVHTMTGTQMSVLESMWPPPGVDDHQNVASMVKGFMELMKLEGKTSADAKTAVSNPGALDRKLKALQPLCMIARSWVFLFTENDKSLAEHVINLAEMARTLFHLFRLKNSSAIPAATYRGIMKAISMHIQNIARCQEEGIDEYYIFQAGTHILEQLFGVARTLVGAQRNFDGLQLSERLSTIVAMFFIYLEHPSWKDHARRLSKSFDHWNTYSWKGCVKPSRVNMLNCWDTGFGNSGTKLSATGLFKESDLDIDAIIAKDPTVSLMFPKGDKSPVLDAEEGECRSSLRSWCLLKRPLLTL